MRIIVHGIGAVGGTLAAALALAGHEVAGIARGAQLQAVRERGLLLRTPDAVRTARFDCVAAPAGIAFRPDDMVILAMKTQDTGPALAQLRDAGLSTQPIFCAQNGVENERMALRLFPNVHAVTVMMPCDFLVPGEVAAFGAPKIGLFDIGRAAGGSDAADTALAEALDSAGFGGFVQDDAMASKYGKLLLNLANMVDAALGRDPANAPILARLRDEAEAALAAAGIVWRDVGSGDPRREALMRIVPITGIERAANSSAQSLARGTGSIETDYLNGEISLLGRLHGVPTPGNDWFGMLGARMVREGLAPGAVPRAEALAALGL